MSQTVTPNNDLVPLSKIDQYQSVLTVSAIRWHRFMNTNGFNEKVCRQFGRKILCHMPSFFAWIEEGNQAEPRNGKCLSD